MNPDEIQEVEIEFEDSPSSEYPLHDLLVNAGSLKPNRTYSINEVDAQAFKLLTDRRKQIEALQDRVSRLEDELAPYQEAADAATQNIVELGRLVALYTRVLTGADIAPDLVRRLVQDYQADTLRAYYGR